MIDNGATNSLMSYNSLPASIQTKIIEFKTENKYSDIFSEFNN